MAPLAAHDRITGKVTLDRLLRITVVLSVFLVAPLGAGHAAGSTCPGLGEAPLALSLDGVDLQGCLPYSPAATWIQPGPDQILQVAYTQGTAPGFSITAIPFGSTAPTEVFPRIDAASSEADLRAVLSQARLKQGAQIQAGPTAQLFGRPVQSLVSTLPLPYTAADRQTTRLTEWLVIAGERLWIFRASQPVSLFGLSATSGLTVDSSNPQAPSISAAALKQAAASPAPPASDELSAEAKPFNLPTPSWWSGTCDNNHYQYYSWGYAAFPLGTSYRNVTACGPLPQWGYPDVLVYFYAGAFPALEWECVELVLRFMYLAYDVAPYSANGGWIVWNYAGAKMEKVNNGIPGKPPVPGDVLSYCSYCTYGHSSVVISTNINSAGNGSIVVMEQNWSLGGRTTLPVSNWAVIGDAGWVYGWLHPKNADIATSTPTRTPTCTPVPARSITPQPNIVTPSPYQLYMPSIYYPNC